jgi:hypothetical protein
MAYEPRPGTFSLFKNDRKESDRHPDYKGNGMYIDGQLVSVAAWLKTDKNGNKFMSCKIEPAQRQDHQRERPADVRPPMGNAPLPMSQRLRRDDPDDSIPF